MKVLSRLRFGYLRPLSRFSEQNIEVECKFRYTKAIEARIRDHGTYLGTKSFTDIYWDTAFPHRLTTRDIWLRQRDAAWEIKVPLSRLPALGVSDAYKETHGLEKVRAFLEKQPFLVSGDGTPPLEGLGLSPFAEITTIRSSFSIVPGFDKTVSVKIDLDCAGTYLIGECEVMLGSESVQDLEIATKTLARVCAELSLDTQPPIRGKVLEFIATHRPRHYQLLEDCGLIQQKLARSVITGNLNPLH